MEEPSKESCNEDIPCDEVVGTLPPTTKPGPSKYTFFSTSTNIFFRPLLFRHPFMHPLISPSIHPLPSTYPFMHLLINLSIHPLIHLSINPPTHPCIAPSIFPSIHQSIRPPDNLLIPSIYTSHPIHHQSICPPNNLPIPSIYKPHPIPSTTIIVLYFQSIQSTSYLLVYALIYLSIQYVCLT